MNKDIIVQKIEELIRKVDTLADTEKRRTKSLNEWIDKQETMEILKCSERTLQTLRDKELLRFSNPHAVQNYFIAERMWKLYLKKTSMAKHKSSYLSSNPSTTLNLGFVDDRL